MATISGIGLNGLGINLASGVSTASGEPSVRSEGFSVYSTKDVYGTGGNVIQLYDSSATPASRDFTATELTDGTYTSWATGTPTVAKAYDQKGSHDIFSGFPANQPLYNATDNAIEINKEGYFGGYRALYGVSSQTIEDNYGGNNLSDEVSFAVRLKSNTGTLGTDVQPMFGAIDNAPTSPVSQRSKAMSFSNSDSKIGSRMKDQSYTEFNAKTDTAITSSYKNYVSTLFRQQFTGDNIFQIYGNGSLEKQSSTNTMDSGDLRVRYLMFGGAAVTSTLMIGFNKRLSEDEISRLNTEMNAF